MCSRGGGLLTSGSWPAGLVFMTFDLQPPTCRGPAQCVPNRKEQGPPFSACTLPCWGFAPFVSIRLQVPSTCLHWPVALAVGHLAPGKGCEATGTGHSCSSPELERSTCNSRFSTLGVTTQHPTLLMLTKCSRHGGGIKKNRAGERSPGPRVGRHH